MLPLSIVRFRSGFGKGTHKIPNALTFVVQFLYSLSGAVNVMLFLTTRSGLLLPNSTPLSSEALWQSSAESDPENGQGESRGSLIGEGVPLSLRASHSTDMRPVERGGRPIGITPLPGLRDETENW